MLSSQRFVCVRQKRLKPTLISNNSKNNRTSYNDKDKDTDKNKNTNQLSTTKNRKFKQREYGNNKYHQEQTDWVKLKESLDYLIDNELVTISGIGKEH